MDSRFRGNDDFFRVSSEIAFRRSSSAILQNELAEIADQLGKRIGEHASSDAYMGGLNEL
jgi:hypothetical protein